MNGLSFSQEFCQLSRVDWAGWWKKNWGDALWPL